MRCPLPVLALFAPLACTATSVPANVGPTTEPASTTEPESTEPESTEPEAPALEPDAAFLLVYEALRDGDWDGFAPFAGAEQIQFHREVSIGEVAPEHLAIPAAEAKTWLAELRATWAPECADMPDPPCRGLNPLSLGFGDDTQIELHCAAAEAQDAGSLCCNHHGALLHNTPFLVQVCFDDDLRVTQVSILDG